MKKVLFATTALVAMSGAAMADVSFEGAANVGIGELNGGSGDLEMYQNISLTAEMAGATDNGLTFGATLTIRSGDDLDLDVGDLNDDGTLSDISFGSIFITGEFGTLTFDRDGIDNLQNDDFSHDLMYSYSIDAFTLSMTADVDDTGDGEEWSVQGSYDDDVINARVAVENGGDFDLVLGYQINDMIHVGVTHESDNDGGNGENTLNLQYATGPVTVDLDLSDVDGEYDFSIGYAEGPLALYGKYGNNDADVEDWDLSATYDLGGGLSVQALTNQSEAYYFGVAMSF
jgi:outer membrane protein OmpU